MTTILNTNAPACYKTKTVSEAIRYALRRGAKLTVTELAERTGKSRVAVDRYAHWLSHEGKISLVEGAYPATFTK